jgi:DNA-binding HxlR family transcriptional regulator
MFNITVTPERGSDLCPVRSILTTVMGKWSSLILLSLEGGPCRFSNIKRRVGDITQRVLTDNLRSLQRDGYLIRTVEAGPPVEVSYALTPLGQSFVLVFSDLVQWAIDNDGIVKKHRTDFDAQ